MGYQFGDLDAMHARYPVDRLGTGWQTLGGERVWCIDRPALGLWAWRGRFPE